MPSTRNTATTTTFTSALLCLVGGLVSVAAQGQQSQSQSQSQGDSGFNVFDHLGADSFYHVSGHPEPLGSAVPRGCNVTRATYLFRHGAIHGQSFEYETYLEPFFHKLGNASVDWESTDDLQFLASYTRPAIEEETIGWLSQRGYDQAVELGRNFSSVYTDNFGLRNPEKVWASSANRTERSARAFAEGYTGAENVTMLQSIYEGEEAGANTLTPNESCEEASGSAGSEEQRAFMELYTAPIAARFNAQMAAVNGTLTNGTAFNFTTNDVWAMQHICGYEVAIRGSSPFCSLELFNEREWSSFEYAQDLMYFYTSVGYGNYELSGSIGMPWVNASADLLLAEEADEDVYFSFTHRQIPPTVYVALGLYNNSAYSGSNDVNSTMPLDSVNPHRQWRSSSILTFLANVGMEKMSCNSYGYPAGEYYRVVASGTTQRLQGCADGPDGISCSRNLFEQWLAERDGMFPAFSGACMVDYDNTTDSLDIYDLLARVENRRL